MVLDLLTINQRNGLKALLNNWVVLFMAVEIIICSYRNYSAKVPGILKKLNNISFLQNVVTIKKKLHLFDTIAPVSLICESWDILASELLFQIQ